MSVASARVQEDPPPWGKKPSIMGVNASRLRKTGDRGVQKASPKPE